jgi:hypothetical protein
MKRVLLASLALSAAGLLGCGERPAPTPPPPPAAAGVSAPATQGIPIRVRIIQGSRKGTAHVDPKLADLKKQLSKLAYVKWEQVKEEQLTMVDKKTQFVELPSGEHVGLTLQEVRGETVTFEVALAQRNTVSRLTVEKAQRIVHQVSSEKGGVAYFVTVRAWQ